MATFTGRSLASGALPNSANTLYAVAPNTKSYVKNFWLYNPGSIDQAITLRLKINGTTRDWRPVTLGAGESCSVLEGEEALNLSAGDEIQGFATTPDVVTYSLHGVEET